MTVVEIRGQGGPEVLHLAQRPVPDCGPGEVLVRVAAAGVNRPDVQQRKGLYPPPAGVTDIPGLDVAGVVSAVGPDVAWPRVGDAVCALVAGGGYAEFCLVPAPQCMPVPRGFTFAQAATLPEVFFTAWNNVIWLGRLAEGETLLVQGGTSGVGLAAMQIGRHLRDATVLATSSSAAKRAVCLEMGADAVVDYRDADWPEQVRALTDGRGVDVILDGQGGDYTPLELGLLAPDGRLVLIASHRAPKAEISTREIYIRRLTLTGSTLRARPVAYKGRIARELVEQVWPLLEAGRIRTHICGVHPLAEAAAAHAVLDANEQIGKLVLTVSDLAETVPEPPS
ncbi:NAD(P)H-quinone oxidoreductase (plasmid) [Roseomonas marmotae]|uniref:NAD(P)H-quinone oxidoreductase n=2 Tax=Roseomonas marmotae TaxID=2768161 RepID=A0ABS3KAM8_9PROT|nr:NAD(P)H-quinone oxidoreductase [Roseomonas marmotae]MBO1074529.1 NAD(P)H-quinone oxidoreductase [Roseomonas marmotae]QTI81743.1 NAD(P)H-quinone oxidoreductase [Roseomonas marmotae]